MDQAKMFFWISGSLAYTDPRRECSLMNKIFTSLAVIVLTVLAFFSISNAIANDASRRSTTLPVNSEFIQNSYPAGRSFAEQNPYWVREAIYAPKYFRYMGIHALRFDSQGNPHIVYGGDYLYYAHHDGADWIIQTVDETGGTGMAASLALDDADRPHIAYQDGSHFDAVLKYARWINSF